MKKKLETSVMIQWLPWGRGTTSPNDKELGSRNHMDRGFASRQGAARESPPQANMVLEGLHPQRTDWKHQSRRMI